MRHMQKTVVLQMVIHIGDEQVEQHPPPKLAHIVNGRMAVRANGIGNLGIAAFLLA